MVQHSAMCGHAAAAAETTIASNAVIEAVFFFAQQCSLSGLGINAPDPVVFVKPVALACCPEDPDFPAYRLNRRNRKPALLTDRAFFSRLPVYRPKLAAKHRHLDIPGAYRIKQLIAQYGEGAALLGRRSESGNRQRSKRNKEKCVSLSVSYSSAVEPKRFFVKYLVILFFLLLLTRLFFFLLRGIPKLRTRLVDARTHDKVGFIQNADGACRKGERKEVPCFAAVQIQQIVACKAFPRFAPFSLFG